MGSGWSSLVESSKFDFNDPRIIDEIQKFIENDEALFMELVGKDFIFDEYKSKRRRVRRVPNKNWWDTPWGRIILDPNIRDVNKIEGQTFRRRFRIPATFFLDYLVPECKRVNIFESKKTKFGEVITQIPIEIKILIALRILARGNVLDDINEFSTVGLSTSCVIFKVFVTNFALYFKDAFIYMPEDEDLKDVMKVYNRLGFPGCIGSMDCTHIRWLACPKELTNLCTGKEHYPTLSFQVIVDHARMIRHVSGGEHGTLNDINICQLDEVIKNDITGLLSSDGQNRNKYGNIIFEIIDKNGKVIRVKGAYLITDGGYENLSIFINPQLLNSSRETIVWSEFIEAVRKDVECTFGILKNRFHFLKFGSRFKDQYVLDAAFVSCCIIHNMLLIIDGLDISSWEKDAAWDSIALDPSLWDLPDDITTKI